MSGPAVTLRLAQPQDARQMAELSRQLIETGLGWRYTPSRIIGLMADRETVALVAGDGARVQGYAVMQFGDVQAHLVLLCVRPALQRQGIGRRLHGWLLASAQVAGMASIALEVRADNDGARAFYRSLGFVETDQLPGYYDGKLAARRMTLDLLSAKLKGHLS